MTEADAKTETDVAETDEKAVDAATGDGEQTDWRKFLDDTDEELKATKPEPDKQAPKEPDLAELRVLAEQGAEAMKFIKEQRTAEAVQNTVKSIKEQSEVLKDHPDRLVKAYLNEFYNENPKIADMIVGGKADAKFYRSLAKEIESDLGSVPDRNLTESAKAARAAVANVSNHKPPDEQPDFSKMSLAEIDEHWKRASG